MASLEGGGTSRQGPIELSSDSDSTSHSSYVGSDAADAGHGLDHNQFGEVCQYRSVRFHDQECERFFDCPTHLVERAPSEGQQGEVGNIVNNGPSAAGEVSPVSEDDGAQGNEGNVSPLPAGRDEQVGESSGGRAPTPPPRDEASLGTAGNPITLPDSPVPQPPAAPVEARVPPTIEDQRQRSSSGLSDVRRPPLILGELHGAGRAESSAQAAAQHHGLAEFTLPRWQPDAEVTYCPICHTQFSIFVRKHHCRFVPRAPGLQQVLIHPRKCGRVVCNSCSPHRITIPYPYIVQPPWVQAAPRLSVPPLGSDGSIPEQFGGERVRLCNPCVPDPNITPPQAQGGHSRSQGNLLQDNAGQPTSRWSSYFGGAPASDPHVRSRSVTMVSFGLSDCLSNGSPRNSGFGNAVIIKGTESL